MILLAKEESDIIKKTGKSKGTVMPLHAMKACQKVELQLYSL
jgi:hypothetical protein